MRDETKPTALHSVSGSGIAFVLGFFFAFRLAITILMMGLLGADSQSGSAARLGLGFLLFAVVCLTSLGALPRWLVGTPTVRWVLLYLAFSGSSLLWGETASAPVSALYWCSTVADVAMVFLLLRDGEVAQITSSLMKGFIWGAVGIACIAWLMPTQYDLRLGDEVYFNSNSICNVCVFAVFFCQYLMRQTRTKLGLVTVFLILTALRSLSKTTIAAFLVSQIVLLIQDRAMSRRMKISLTFASIVVVLAFWGLFEAYYDFYTTNGNQAETLTGRTAIWAYLLNAVPEHLWIGHGFDSMWNVVPAFGTFEARHAENELLEQLYSYGIVGLVLLCGIYVSLYRGIRRFASPSWKAIGTSMMLFVVVRGVAEAEPFDLLLPLWMVVMFGALLHKPTVDEAELQFALQLKSPRDLVPDSKPLVSALVSPEGSGV
jgi:exopolysaccharide production protein ExoQ